MNQPLTQGCSKHPGPADEPLSPILDTVFDPSEFGVFLRQRMEGKTIGQVTAHLGVSENYLAKMLEGKWRPTKAVCRRLGLRIAYVVRARRGGFHDHYAREVEINAETDRARSKTAMLWQVKEYSSQSCLPQLRLGKIRPGFLLSKFLEKFGFMFLPMAPSWT